MWELTATDKQGKRLPPGKFLAQEGVIYVNNDAERKRVGSYTQSGAKVRIDITNAGNPAANGVYQLVQVGKKPPTYAGQFTSTAGISLKVDLRIVVD